MSPPTGEPSTPGVDLSFLVVSVISLTVLYSFTINILFGHQTYWRSLEEWIPRQLMTTLSHIQQFSASYTQPSLTNDNNNKNNFHTTIARSKKRAVDKAKESIRRGRAQLGELDDNVLVSILTYLPAADIMEFSSINRSFARASNARYLWSLKWQEIQTRFPSQRVETEDTASTCSGMKDFFTRCWHLRHMLLTATSSDATSSTNGVISPNDETRWPSTCPVLVNGDVYELRHFLRHHPGGALILLEWKGQDASTIFNLAAHSHQAKVQMKPFMRWEQQNLLGRRGWPTFVVSPPPPPPTPPAAL